MVGMTSIKKRKISEGGSQLGEERPKRVSFGAKVETNEDPPKIELLKQETVEEHLKSILKVPKKQVDGAAVVKKTKKIKEGGAKQIVKEPKPKTDGKKQFKLQSVRPANFSVQRKERKEKLLKQKLAKRPYYATVLKAKKLWEAVRNRKTEASRRTELIAELFQLVEGKAKELIHAHDAARILQCLMALKDAEIRDKIFDELKDDLLPLSKMKYSKFFVTKMLKYGTPAQRTLVINSLYGHILELMKHSVAGDVVELAYNDYANGLQRSKMASEFYGAEFKLFKSEEVVTLESVLKTHAGSAPTIMMSLKENLVALTSKSVLRHSLVHRLLREFFQHCQPDQRAEVADSIKEKLVEILHTRDGTLAALDVLWHSGPKDRKIILKSLKGFVTKICSEEQGYMFLLGIFDSVDDTVLVNKTVLEEIKLNLKEILKNKYGVKVVHYLLSPRDPRHFFPDVVKILKKGDAVKKSKKDDSVRSQELLDKVVADLLEFFTENCREMIMDPHTCLLALSLGQNAKLAASQPDAKQKFYAAIAEVASEEFVPSNSESYHIVEHPQGQFLLKHLLRADIQLHKDGHPTLAEAIVSKVEPEKLRSWIACNKGTFVLADMMKTEVPVVVATIRKAIQPATMKRLKSYSFAGAKVLLELLN